MELMDLLIAHMDDLAEKAAKTGYAASRFLSPAEARYVEAHFRNKHAALSFDGGYEGAERVRTVFLNPDWGECGRARLFAACKIKYRTQDTLGRRDILGALMALGIERDTIGDIIAGDGFSALVCLPELGGYITENLTKAGRAGVTVSEIGFDELPARQEELIEKTDTVASLRLDSILCVAFGLSRAKAVEIIAEGRVSLNHLLCLQPAKELPAGALLSVRGLGRARLLEVGGLSKKGRIFVRIGVYGR